MTPELRNATTNLLTRLCPPQEARRLTRVLGVVRRQGKVDAYALRMVTVLGLVVRGPTAISQLGQLLRETTSVGLARSSFWSRLTPEFTRLMAWWLNRFVEESRREHRRPPGALSFFRDVIAADASVMKVHDDLRGVWKGTRRNTAMAALKVHA
ncbi:MAG: hypothetical protein GWP91_14265 [Rhodobacterales bacterium]|nr:hypothetical protein [Rhodobacterales bacterium]